jgi:hypothetical protein
MWRPKPKKHCCYLSKEEEDEDTFDDKEEGDDDERVQLRANPYHLYKHDPGCCCLGSANRAFYWREHSKMFYCI